MYLFIMHLVQIRVLFNELYMPILLFYTKRLWDLHQLYYLHKLPQYSL